MIDIHYHLIPNMDDGPDTIECALEMVKISYDQGVRTIVATPHLNHPAEFRGHMANDKDMLQEFEKLRTYIQTTYPDMELYLGAEVYLSKQDLSQLEQVEMRTMNKTRYVLVEFRRDIPFEEMDKGLQGLIALGYQPILAHAEVYNCFTSDMEGLLNLREQGVLIQCSAGNIIDIRQKPEKTRAKEMLRHGLVDIIASNGHNLITNKPDMTKAYTYVTKKYGAEEAKRLFEVNPKIMLADQVVPQAIRQIKPSQPINKKWIYVATIIALAILTRCTS
ncbi:tyrosine-protein phosphatase [Petrocella sp. FN5]|uniref:tyrosine-protein phosphatase n=1 Tax=Petrocella sp. FN5 TaxID=3032002 RepID=UPI0023DBD2A3|nr:CpsB/CapC family capsule biosynthesis tyrosine phosphatase [Petrocella sp. FN5]MDF1616970.1 hypothetical protein [Petrocella sp. FN5]